MDTWSTDTWDRAYVVILIVTAWLIPLLIITYCYLKVRWIFVTSLGGIYKMIFFCFKDFLLHTNYQSQPQKSTTSQQ